VEVEEEEEEEVEVEAEAEEEEDQMPLHLSWSNFPWAIMRGNRLMHRLDGFR